MSNAPTITTVVTYSSTIPEEMYTSKPLVGVKEKVFETMDEFSSVECDYLIAYVPDIVWGDTLDILSEKL